MEALSGEHIPAAPQSIEGWRRLILEVGPAVLEAVAAFAYGMELITQVMERRELGAHRVPGGHVVPDPDPEEVEP